MIKSEFENCVNAAMDKIKTDYHTFTRIMLFCDYLWREIDNTNSEQVREERFKNEENK